MKNHPLCGWIFIVRKIGGEAKINLRKDHRIKAGASVIDGKALMSIGYEQGHFEALAHFDGGRYKGATVMYNVVEW